MPANIQVSALTWPGKNLQNVCQLSDAAPFVNVGVSVCLSSHLLHVWPSDLMDLKTLHVNSQPGSGNMAGKINHAAQHATYVLLMSPHMGSDGHVQQHNLQHSWFS